jgi:hypothetical protein
MRYTLLKLSPRAYDLDLDGSIVGRVIQNVREGEKWRAELLNPASGVPAPFADVEEIFPSLDEVRQWLGNAEVRDDLHA